MRLIGAVMTITMLMMMTNKSIGKALHITITKTKRTNIFFTWLIFEFKLGFKFSASYGKLNEVENAIKIYQ
jgi:hypothetical protein